MQAAQSLIKSGTTMLEGYSLPRMKSMVTDVGEERQKMANAIASLKEALLPLENISLAGSNKIPDDSQVTASGYLTVKVADLMAGIKTLYGMVEAVKALARKKKVDK